MTKSVWAARGTSDNISNSKAGSSGRNNPNGDGDGCHDDDDQHVMMTAAERKDAPPVAPRPDSEAEAGGVRADDGADDGGADEEQEERRESNGNRDENPKKKKNRSIAGSYGNDGRRIPIMLLTLFALGIIAVWVTGDGFFPATRIRIRRGGTNGEHHDDSSSSTVTTVVQVKVSSLKKLQLHDDDRHGGRVVMGERQGDERGIVEGNTDAGGRSTTGPSILVPASETLSPSSATVAFAADQPRVLSAAPVVPPDSCPDYRCFTSQCYSPPSSVSPSSGTTGAGTSTTTMTGSVDGRSTTNNTSTGTSVSPCEPSPYYLPPQRHIEQREETKCVDSTEPAAPPLLPPPVSDRPSTSSSSPSPSLADTLDEKLAVFQHLTAQPFRAWYPWSGKWIRGVDGEGGSGSGTPGTGAASTGTPATMSSGHVGPDALYLLNNVCLRPTGSLAGYQPKIGAFVGGDDVYTATKVKKTMKHFARYLHNVESLPEPPKAYLDTKVVMMPLIGRSSNPGHAFHRMVSLFEVRQKAFPDATVNDTTTVYVMPETSRDMASGVSLSDFGATGFTHYTTMVTQSHFAVFGHQERETLEKVFGNVTMNDPRLNNFVCFKKIAVYFTCMYKECEKARRRPVPRPIFPIFYHRSAELLGRFNERLRECAGVKARPEPRRQHPTVLLSIRSRNRRWSLSPQIVGMIGDVVTNQLNGKLVVHEMKDAGALELIRLYNDADIVVSPYGAGLFYSIMMPPGSAALEIAYNHYKCATVTGINRGENAWCDYGGSFRAAGVHHVFGLLDTVANLRILGDGFAEFDLGLNVVNFLFNRTVCVLQSGGSIPGDGGCGFSPQDLNNRQQIYLDDEDGFSVRSLIRNRNLEALGVWSRLPWLYRRAENVAEKLRPMRRHIDRPSVLIVTPCSNAHGVFAEASFFNAYLRLDSRVARWVYPSSPFVDPLTVGGTTATTTGSSNGGEQVHASIRVPCSSQRVDDDAALFPGSGSGPNAVYYKFISKMCPLCTTVGPEASNPLCRSFDVVFYSSAEVSKTLVEESLRPLLKRHDSVLLDAEEGFSPDSLPTPSSTASLQ